MHYEKASAEVITFVNGGFIMTYGGNTGGPWDPGGPWGSGEEFENSLDTKRSFPGRQ